MTKSFVEEQTLKLPNVQDGPGAIGDLWNCHSSESVGFNLFGKNLQSDHLVSDARQAQIFTLTHVKNTKDKSKTISVSAEVSLELMGGLISVSGQGEYDENKDTTALDEVLSCDYHLETFSVRSLPAAKSAMDPLVTEKLLKGEFKATHVVTKIILGAEVNASVVIKSSDAKESQKIKGGFMGKLMLGPVSAMAKAALTLLDSEVGHGFDKRITINAKPPIKASPATIEEMFAAIKSIDDNIKGEKHFPQLSTDDKIIIGVPLRFHLVPIRDYLDVKVEMLYMTISDTIMDEFKVMLLTLKDLQIINFIKKKILEKDGRISLILSDASNGFTRKINQWEVEMKKRASVYFLKATQTLKEYKIAKKSIEDISILTKEFDKKFDLTELYQIKIQDWTNEGKQLLIDAGIPDIEENEKIRVFTNKTELQDWFGGERGFNILLKTKAGGPSIAGTFGLYEIGQELARQNISVGVAVPNIFEEFSLNLKIRDKLTTYSGQDISFALRVLTAFVDPGQTPSARFFKICANIAGLQFTQNDHLSNFPSLISFLKRNFNFFKMADTYLQLLDEIMVEDQELKYVLTTEALYSAYDSMRKVLEFRENFPEGKWIVGNLEIEEEQDAPLLFVFKNGKLIAILFDNLDFITFAEASRRGNEFPIRSEGNIDKNYIHPDKLDFLGVIQRRLQGGKRTTRKSVKKYSRDESVEDVMKILAAWLSRDKFQLLKQCLDILKLHHEDEFRSTQASQLYDNSGKVFINSENLGIWQNFLTALSNQANPFLIEIQIALEILEEKPGDGRTQELIRSVTANSNCPLSLKEILGSKSNFTFDELTRHLTNAKNEIFNKSSKHHLTAVIEIVENYIKNETSASSKDEIKIYGILNVYIGKLNPSTHWADDWHERIKQDAGQNNFYSILNYLSPLRFHPKIGQIQNKMELISDASAKGISTLLVDLAQLKLEEKELRQLFSCPVFLHYLSKGLDDYLVLMSIRDLICTGKIIPNYVSNELKEKLEDILTQNEITLSTEFHTLKDAFKKFHQLIQVNILPGNFQTVLLRSLNNQNFLTEMHNCEALFYYNPTQRLFDQAWDIDTVRAAYRKIEDTLENLENEKHNIEYSELKMEMPMSFPDEQEEARTPVNHGINEGTSLKAQNSDLEKLIDLKNLEYLTMQKFVEVCSLVEQPQFSENEEIVRLNQVMSYIVHKIKMWGVHALQPEFIQSFFKKVGQVDPAESTSKTNDHKPRRKLNFKCKADENKGDNEVGSDMPSKKVTPLSRIDILTCLLNYCEPIVFQDILKNMSQFPVALPLIMNNFWMTSESSPKYISLQDLLKISCFKWETTTGGVLNNHLFKNNFKLILAIRISSAEYSVGKSTILNQFLSTKNAFSSKSEPGSKRGKAVFLHGTVEFIPLTQETCISSFYEQSVKGHYNSDLNEVALLANLHGNAIEFPELLEELRPLVSSYIIFINRQGRQEMEANYSKLESILDLSEEFLVDPLEECKHVVESNRIVDTTKLVDDSTLEKIRAAIKDCLSRENVRTAAAYTNATGDPHPLVYSLRIETPHSKRFIDYVKSKSCSFVKDRMALQKPEYQKKKILKHLYDLWRNGGELRYMMGLFASCLFLPVEQRNKAMIHIDREISGLSSKDSEKCRGELLELKEAQSRILNLEDPRLAARQRDQLLRKIKLKYEELDRISLGMEHFYREIGRIYEIGLLNQNDPVNKGALQFPALFAELLVQGHALEILDGDLGDINERWFTAVCGEVGKTISKDAKIFVVSILGLQSSGKSTLLNALFGCKFAVSTGRCTKGLFMRLLLLDKNLGKDLGVDLILLIDTEGLGAPEKMNDEDNEQKDRLMATFAMSVSNLTLINVLGESLRDLTGILQIVIVTMARLEQANISPDILMVQHLQERDKSKTLGGSDEFCKAIDEAIKVTDTKNVTDIGIKNSKSLQKLIQRVQDGRILKQFRSFKSGATLNAPPSKEYHEDVLNLFETILQSCRELKHPLKFRTWVDLMPKYWSSVSYQNFALRFKNVKEICEFLERGNRIALVKEAFNEALHTHKENCETSIREKFHEFESLATKNSSEWNSRKDKLLREMTDVVGCLPYCRSSSENAPCPQCINFVNAREELFKEVENKASEIDTKSTITNFENERKDSLKKQLTQFIHAQEVKNGYSSDFDKIIENILRDKLKIKNDFTENERKQMVEEIWGILRQTVSTMNNLPPVKRRIIKEAQIEYRDPDFIRSLGGDGGIRGDSLPDFSEIDAFGVGFARKHFRRVKPRIDFQQRSKLEADLEHITDVILQESKSKYFEDGMVRKLNLHIKGLTQAFKNDIKEELLPKFTWAISEYGLKHFISIMESKEPEWDALNNPMTILNKRETQFRKDIDIRLKYGFTFDGEGRIVGEKIMQTLHKLCSKSSNKFYRDSILEHTWMTNSGNVRLQYFEELVGEVRSGYNGRALKHFADPKSQIRKWFSRKVDSFSSGAAEEHYKKTAQTEFDQVLQLIKNEKKGLELKKVFDKLFSKVDGVDYRPKVDFAKAQPSDCEVFKARIFEELKMKKSWLVEAEDFSSSFELPSANADIVSRLGCSEHCFWCGALCWGQYGHDKNVDGTGKHHTSHQPMGLIATYDLNDDTLIPHTCDETPLTNNCEWSSPSAQTRLKETWRNAMVHEDFRHWTFAAHPQDEFNNLMKWFFYNLQGDIAKDRGYKVARSDEIKRRGYNSLSIDSILITIATKIGS